MELNLLPAALISLVVFVLMYVFFTLGALCYKWRKRKLGKEKKPGFGAVEGSLLGLLALMLAFTFSMSSGHYERRVQIVNEEANAIGTAILRSDLYPDSVQKEFRKDFKRYLETRIQFREAGTDMPKVYAALDSSLVYQKRLWERAVYYGRKPEYLVQTAQMVPALNAVIDIVGTRKIAVLNKVPEIIFYVLYLLCFVSAFIIGYSIGDEVDWPIKLGFMFMTSLALYLAMDLDRPRRGIITMEFADQQIRDLRTMFTTEE